MEKQGESSLNWLILRQFFKLESAGGIVLLLSAILALALDNSFCAPYYDSWRAMALHIPFGFFSFHLSMMAVVNDGLMTIFFLLVGFELKREWVFGDLADRSKVVLPAVAALGGMVVPAAIYIFLNWHHPATHAGWAIPVATDIAFALGVLSLFGRKIPLQLKLFLMLLAIFDDIGAIIIIAVFFSAKMSWLALGFSGAVIALLLLMVQQKIHSLLLWCAAGVLLWVSFLFLGVHPVVAGVVLGVMMPADKKLYFEKLLHPWVAFFIMPLFALMNAGVNMQKLTFASLQMPVLWGVIGGLFIGKPLGVGLASMLCLRAKWAHLPAGSSWQLFMGVAFLCGIGFTMSLFLGTLAFPSGSDSARLAVLIGSFASAVTGSLILFLQQR